MISSRQLVATDLFQELSRASEGAAAGYLISARAVLERLLARPGLLGGLSLERNPASFAGNLLFGGPALSHERLLERVGV